MALNPFPYTLIVELKPMLLFSHSFVYKWALGKDQQSRLEDFTQIVAFNKVFVCYFDRTDNVICATRVWMELTSQLYHITCIFKKIA